MTQPFFRRLDYLDIVISRGPQECDFFRDVEPLVTEPASWAYFCDTLHDSSWLTVLLHAGRFQTVPDPILNAEKQSNFHPNWPESKFLTRVASQAPEQVKEIIAQIPDTSNVRVHEDFVEVAINLPPDMAADLGRSEANWISSQFHPSLYFPDRLSELIRHLASGDQIDTALELASALFAILPDPNIQPPKITDDETYRPLPRPRPRFSSWDYESALQSFVNDVVPVARQSAVSLLCELLSDSIRLSHHPTENEEREDYSHIWRSSIESGDSRRGDDLENLLVSAVRDASTITMEHSPVDTLNLVEKQTYRVFQRIGLYLRRIRPDADADGTAMLVTDRNVIDDPDLHHELFILLQEQFNNLPPIFQNGYLSLVDEGVDAKSWIDYRVRETGEQPNEEEIARFVHQWQYRRLIPVKEFLDEDWADRYRNFQKEFGELDHPDVLSSFSSSWGGPNSPSTQEELQSMTIESLISYLQDWKPSGDIMDPSPEGLGRMLTSVVAMEPAKYAAESAQFQNVAPTYVRGLIEGLKEALKNKRAYAWRPVIELCKWIATQPDVQMVDDSRDWEDPNLSRTRKQIVDLIQTGFQDGEEELPYDELRNDAWEIIQILTEDPDPGSDEDYGENSLDPATRSINSTRGEAMHAVIRYALWVRRHQRKVDEESEDLPINFDDIPEVRTVLELHLDPAIDSSLAIRSVYGQWFPWLVLLDKVWATEHADSIFPEHVKSRPLTFVAWDTYLNFCSGYDDVFDILRPRYLQAIERIDDNISPNKTIGDPNERLTEHLMGFFWRDLLSYDEDDGMLSRFYANATNSLKAHAIDFLGRNLHNNQDVPVTVLGRLMELCEGRLGIISQQPTAEGAIAELVPFGWWIDSNKFDTAWVMGQLRQILAMSKWVEPDGKVIDWLAESASELPAETVECLGLMMEGDDQGWHTRMWADQSRNILSTALSSSNASGRQTAEELVHRLGSRGYLQYRDLVQSR